MTIDLGVLISGTGTNLGAILDAIRAKELDARVKLVVSNRRDAQGLLRAAAHEVETRVLSHKSFPDRESFDAELVATLRAAGVEWIVLAGFMRIITPVLLDAFVDRVINIHPSLLPSFPGVDAQAQAVAYGARISGCTVHFVDAGVDSGPVILQESVPVLETDDRDALASRILEREHECLVRALGYVSAGRLSIVTPSDGARRRVLIGPPK